MKFFVRVKTRCSERSIEDFGDGRYLVCLKEVASHNDANRELINYFAKHIGVPPLKLKIISGATSRDKVLEVVY